MMEMKSYWNNVGATPLPTCLGIIMVTDSLDETYQAREQDCVQQTKKWEVRHTAKKKSEEAEAAAKKAVVVANAAEKAATKTPLKELRETARQKAKLMLEAVKMAKEAAVVPVKKGEKEQTPMRTAKNIRKLMRSFTGFEINNANKIDTITPHCLVSLCGLDKRCVFEPNGLDDNSNDEASIITNRRAIERHDFFQAHLYDAF